MSSSNRVWTRKGRALFYILSIYLLTMFFWWWFMMYRQNSELYREKEKLLFHIHQQDDSELIALKHAELLSEKERKRLMILGEGISFLVLMLLGIYSLRSNISKEVKLASMENNFLLSITHELKSPLASAKLNLQTLASRELSQEQMTTLINNTEVDVTRLNDLVEKILLASRMGHHDFNFLQEEVNFSELVELVADISMDRHHFQNLNVKVQNDIWVNGDEVLLKSLVLNLIENAIKYAPKDTFIDILLNKKSGMLVLSITDQGKLIPDQEKEKIFNRFYRMGSEETRTSTGVGLGLFIVYQVAKMHHGDVQIIDQPSGGKTFKVEMPYIGAI